MDIIDRILNELKTKNKSQVDFADFLGVPKSLITHWKAGRNNSYMKYLPQISDYLGVSVDYLLGTPSNKEKPRDADAELNEYLEVLKNRPEMKMLFSLAKGATKEDVEQAVRIIEALRKQQ